MKYIDKRKYKAYKKVVYREKKYYCNCGCGGNNCALFSCGENCRFL